MTDNSTTIKHLAKKLKHDALGKEGVKWTTKENTLNL